jgi:hypothetical protein
MIHIRPPVLASRLRRSSRAIAPDPTMTEIGKRAVITYYTFLKHKPFVRAVVRLLRRLGVSGGIA